MRLFLTGDPCDQIRHCYYVEGASISFLVDCGYQRCYEGDEVPHLSHEQIRAARYLFLTHSHENQSGALPYLLSHGFTGQVVLTTETARQLPFPVDDPILLEALSVPYAEALLPGGLSVVWGRSGHCSGSVWYKISEGRRSIFFSGDYYYRARVHASDPIVGQSANLAVLDCSYGVAEDSNEREDQVAQLITAISDALSDGRPVLLPVPKYGRAMSILSYINEHLPDTDVFGDAHFIRELGHLDATAMWVRQETQELLGSVFVRSIPQDFVALGIYFVSDPQLDTPEARRLVQRLLVCGGRVILTGRIEPKTHAALLAHSGKAVSIRYGIHCNQADMERIATQNNFDTIIAYQSAYAPIRSVYEV